MANALDGLDTATSKEVAEYLHTTEAGLAQMRYRGIGPKFVKVTSRKVIYRWADVQAFLDANTCQRTDDPRGAA
ncbi:helix-turn-helix transcriptional regulator [Mycolicibacterium baixiangningiae]|uniref:helix-turn-helix transcriptional regulator n=1 Tax=Mycolicibacterium baixiangningiae TaxID=2761578 RepID=UPI001868813B|nr:DNA-binding protein [Mycolicibacterium baixiangningiae]